MDKHNYLYQYHSLEEETPQVGSQSELLWSFKVG